MCIRDRIVGWGSPLALTTTTHGALSHTQRTFCPKGVGKPARPTQRRRPQQLDRLCSGGAD
eukprot:4897228-Alexandrium_andersonii.AAC.1